MCGRTACTLDKQGIQRATCQYSKDNSNIKWIEKYTWQNYKPSYNLAPTQISPVLVNESTYDCKEKSNIVITPMRWGFIPSWYKGSLARFSLSTNNCRLEGILEKPMFKQSVLTGQRCVVLADGFYEWKEIGNKQKQPYFIYFPQKPGSKVFEQDQIKSNDEEIKYPHLLTMAGLFDVWKNPEGEVIYSYSIITLNSSNTVSFVHSRMPAILNGKEEVSMWLDTSRITTRDAISILKPLEELHMHPVSTFVNFSRNNSVDCLKPKSEKNSTPLKSTALTRWLKKESPVESPAKRIKKEE